MNAAQKRLDAAQRAVDDARAALLNAQAEVRTLAAEAADVDAAITQAINDAVRNGKAPHVDGARQTLRRLEDQRATAQSVCATLTDVIRERERELERVRFEEFPALRNALDKAAEELASRFAEVHARYAAELEPLEQAARHVQHEWGLLRGALPPAIAQHFRAEVDALTIPELGPDVSLAQYDPSDPSLPGWVGPVIEQSRELVKAQNPPVPVGIPVAP